MNLFNESLTIAYGKKKAKEMLDHCLTPDWQANWLRNARDKEINEVVTSTSHRYLADEKNSNS
jgi:hypothetical protein